MDENVKGFMLFSDQKVYVDMLSTEQKASLLDALFEFSTGQEPKLEDKLTQMAFMIIKQSIERAWKKSETLKANASRPKQKKDGESKTEQTEAKESKPKQSPASESKTEQTEAKRLNDTDTDTDTVNDKNIKDTPPISPSEGEGVREPYSDEFNEFWASYPKKTGKDAAWRAWCTKRREKRLPSVGELITKLDEFRETEEWQKEGGRFIPNPATWINQARWMDEITEGGLTAAEKERILESMRRANRAYRQNI